MAITKLKKGELEPMKLGFTVKTSKVLSQPKRLQLKDLEIKTNLRKGGNSHDKVAN